MNPAPTLTFGDLLRRYRRAAGLTQEDLADRAQLSPRAISDLERGLHNRLWRDTVRLLADALVLTPSKRAHFEAAGRAHPRPPTDDPPSGESVPFTRSRDNLPTPTNSLVGREQDLGRLERLLPTTRLLTLTGPGGCGKTRLALALAQNAIGSYSDGVWLIDLAPLADADLVPRSVATVLGNQDQPNDSRLGTLVAFLRARSTLLVLDNCEHLIDACAHLADTLLHGCPHVRVLATSREGLGIPGETTWLIPPLTAPPAEALSADEIAAFPAVRLFAERAAAVRPDFGLDAINASSIAQICRRLDGIPLAVELAAACTRSLGVDQIAARLDQRFHLLTGGSRVARPRQQTLAAAVDWSYDLLTAPERTLFNRLAVFAGGFTLAAAEAVCGDESTGSSVLDLLSRLVGKSMVVADADGEGAIRYRLLETLRQFAFGRLAAVGEVELVSRRHAFAYLAFARDAEPVLRGAGEAAWLHRLDRDHHNLRAALDWFQANDLWIDGLALASAIAQFWRVRGHYTEGRARLAGLIDGCKGPAPAQLLAAAFDGLATLAIRQGDMSEAARSSEACLSAATEADDKRLMIRALRRLGDYTANPADRRAHYQQALNIARDAGYESDVLWVLLNLAEESYWSGDLAGSAAQIADALPIVREAGDSRSLIYGVVSAFTVAMARGEYQRARSFAAEHLTIAQTLGDQSSKANALLASGALSLAEGDLDSAEPLFATALETYRDVADQTGVSWAEAYLSEALLLRGEDEQARFLAADSLDIARQRPAASRAIIPLALRGAGEVALARGDIDVAASYFREGLASFAAPDWRSYFLDALARVSATRGASARALRLTGTAAAHREAQGVKMRPIDQVRVERALEMARQALTGDEQHAAYAEGQAMTLEQAVAYALEDAGR